MDCLIPQFLALMKHHLGKDDVDVSSSTGTPTGHGYRLDSDDFLGNVSELFKQMDLRGDGEVSWDDFSAVRRRLKGARRWSVHNYK